LPTQFSRCLRPRRFTFDLTLEAAFAKMQVLIARGCAGEALRQALDSPLCGECTL
jgi:hypothetical protein